MKETLTLKSETIPYFYNKEKLIKLKQELEQFLQTDGKYMDSKTFAIKFLGCQEIQANNSIEGYNDDVDTIQKVIEGYQKKLPEERKKIIRNMYNGYRQILKQEPINKDTLKQLYKTLSQGLLEEEDQKNMGKYYRTKEVYIHYSSIFQIPPDTAINPNEVEEYMDSLFDYLNTNDVDTPTEHYIKSQIAHYYLVYVHPYFDINGRTSRTLSMWYLLNNEIYPYIIFNRAIPLLKKRYNKIIRETKKYKNLTYFLNFMLESVQTELEKEYVINSIEEIINTPLTEEEYQNLRYILSMHGQKTAKDFTNFYDRINTKTPYEKIKQEKLQPLIDKGALEIQRNTKDGNNYIFEVAQNKDIDPKYLKKLQIKNSH